MEGVLSKASQLSDSQPSGPPQRWVVVCLVSLGGLLDPGKGLASHRPLLFTLGAGGHNQIVSTQLGSLRKVKYPGKKLIPVIPPYPSGSLRGSNRQ